MSKDKNPPVEQDDPSKCPACSGSGGNPADMCDVCHGSGVDPCHAPAEDELSPRSAALRYLRRLMGDTRSQTGKRKIARGILIVNQIQEERPHGPFYLTGTEISGQTVPTLVLFWPGKDENGKSVLVQARCMWDPANPATQENMVHFLHQLTNIVEGPVHKEAALASGDNGGDGSKECDGQGG